MHKSPGSPRPSPSPDTAADTAVGPADAAGDAVEQSADAFLLASRALVGVAATSLAGLDEITLPQFRALVVLSGTGPATVGALADELDVHPSTATRLCDRLVRKGLVDRSRPGSDRRTTEVSLTPAGRQTVDEVTDRRHRAIVAVVRRLSPAQRTAGVAALQAFASAAGEQLPADAFGWSPATGRERAVGEPTTGRETGTPAGETRR